MTTLTHDDVAATAVEEAVARLRPAPGPAGGRRLTSVGVPGPADTRGTPPVARPQLRLVPTLPDARTSPAAPHDAPPLLRERTRRLAVTLRDAAGEPEDERGAAPATDAGRFAHGVGLACVEVALGRRPAAQLARWVTPGVLDALQHRADLVRRAGVLTHARVPAARRVRVAPVDAHTAEACLVVDDGVRVRAVALRLEAHRGAWRVATLEIG